jgi:hypothetical protein
MDALNIVLFVFVILLLILYVYDRIRSIATTTREFTFPAPQENIMHITVLVKKNDVKELYLVDENNYCTKVNF